MHICPGQRKVRRRRHPACSPTALLKCMTAWRRTALACTVQLLVAPPPLLLPLAADLCLVVGVQVACSEDRTWTLWDMGSEKCRASWRGQSVFKGLAVAPDKVGLGCPARTKQQGVGVGGSVPAPAPLPTHSRSHPHTLPECY